MLLTSDIEVTEIAETSPEDTTESLREFCENGFDGNLEQAALVLGRPEDELRRMLEGTEEVDTDLVMKIRGIAQQRKIDIGIQFPDEDVDDEGVESSDA